MANLTIFQEVRKITSKEGLVMRALSLAGFRFGRLVVIRRHGHTKHGNITWWCQCDCGKELEVPGGALRKRNTKSCGCLHKGETNPNYKHGGRHSSAKKGEYNIWCAIKQRCYYKKHIAYLNYGGRGITVCERWRCSFKAFYEDMGPRPSSGYSIERIDPNGPYSPENCCWIPKGNQRRNQRRSIRVKYCGEEKSLADWAEILGIPYHRVYGRIRRGWSGELAIEAAVNSCYAKKPKNN